MVLGAPKQAAEGAVRIMGKAGDKAGGQRVNQMLPLSGTLMGQPVASLAIALAAVTIVVGMVVM